MPKQFFKYALKFIIYLLIMMIVYGVVMGVAMLLPSQFTHHQHDGDDLIDIYLISNGVHTDFVLPTHTKQINWTDLFDPKDTKNDMKDKWIGIGWGDRDFYLNTPNWSDLKPKTAFNALSGLSTSVLHVSFEPDKIVQNCQKCRKITLNSNQYQAIVNHILTTLPTQGKQTPIAHIHYWHNDAFYPAQGSYNAFYTCNSWVNNGLKKANIKTALWTVLDTGVIKEW